MTRRTSLRLAALTAALAAIEGCSARGLAGYREVDDGFCSAFDGDRTACESEGRCEFDELAHQCIGQLESFGITNVAISPAVAVAQPPVVEANAIEGKKAMKKYCKKFNNDEAACLDAPLLNCKFKPKKSKPGKGKCTPSKDQTPKEPTEPTEPEKPKESGTVNADLPAAGESLRLDGITATTKLVVSPSRTNQVTVITDLSGGPQARSYDGGEWEALVPGASAICEDGICNVEVSAAAASEGAVDIATYAGPASSPNHLNARFLMQATFGPTRSDISALGTSSSRWENWVRAQAEMPASLLREYYRRHVNQPMATQLRNGRPSKPCEPGSRWHRHAFVPSDVGKDLVVHERSAYFELEVEGVSRHHWTDKAGWNLGSGNLGAICSVEPRLGGEVTFGAGCDNVMNNPGIEFTSIDADRTLMVGRSSLQELTPPVDGVKILSTPPGGCAAPGTGPVFATTSGTEEAYMHEARIVLLDNTLEQPATGALSDAACPETPRTIFNADSCVVGKTSCAPTQYTSAEVTLDGHGIRTFFTTGGKYVYTVLGLSNEDVDSPCDQPSRWKIEAGACSSQSNMDGATRETLSALLRDSFANDGNPEVRDIPVPGDDSSCNSGSARRGVITVERNGAQYCFSQVHPDLYGVFDLSYWALPYTHPGNAGAFEDGRYNPIKKIAELDGSAFLNFPSWHPLGRWESYKEHFPKLGRYRDMVDFAALPTRVQSAELAAAFGSAALPSVDSYTVSCGSPGEVANEPRLGSRFGMGTSSSEAADFQRGQLDERTDRSSAHTTVWTMNALYAPDQLRQRVAWTLSQILVVGARDAGGSGPSEQYLAFYDIFVRNAFGKYRDALREVSYSPLMGRYLSFMYSRSKMSSGSFPDENYAREIMQLFTMGLWQLNPDGTPVLDDAGDYVPTYSNEDILEFSRAWTGFERQDRRNNHETPTGQTNGNEIDPMKIRGRYRDPFPKLGLGQRYVGDGYPICEELPERTFLRAGATYRFLGSSPVAELQSEPNEELHGELAFRVELDPRNSALAATLCGADNAANFGRCKLKSQVVLDANLECHGTECDIDTVRTVMIPETTSRCPEGSFLRPAKDAPENGDVCEDGYDKEAFTCPTGCTPTADGMAPFCMSQSNSNEVCRIDGSEHRGLFFEYVPAPCVHLAFFNDGKRIVTPWQSSASCADPRTVVAGEACCDPAASSWALDRAYNGCKYAGERLSFEAASQRCQTSFKVPMAMCDFRYTREYCHWRPSRVWADAQCNVQVKVDASGRIAIVHDVGQAPRDEVTADEMQEHLNRDTDNWFRAVWSGAAFPTAASGDCGACETLPAAPGGEPTCLCDTEAVEEMVFSDMPTVEEAIEQLSVGSAPLEVFDSGTFSLAGSGSNGDVKVYHHKDGGNAYTKQTVFRVLSLGRTLWLRNVRSKVRVVGSNAVFRNPPTFHNMDMPETTDAMHETEAVLDHYLYQPTTAPFLSKLMIQHLVTSNPAPRYVKTVAKAFSSGSYDGIGSGEYGDLLATTAAILLYRDARSVVLDADPAHGQLRQPMLKLIHAMRALEIQANVPYSTQVVLRSLDERIGMEPLDAPSVFSFYLPAFSPAGALGEAGLVSPESQLLTSPVVVSTLNSFFSLVKYGLTSCEEGLGLPRDDSWSCRDISYGDPPADKSTSRGRLAFVPTGQTAAAVIDELDLLLTGSHLDAAARDVMIREYDAELQATGSSDKALQLVLQLFFVSPHFHSSNVCQPSQTPRPEEEEDPEPPARANAPHKAVIYVNFQGGMDSFSALVPKRGCQNGKDLYEEYRQVRGNVAISENQLLDISASGQPCSTFGVHPALKTVRALYQDDQALFLANTGALVEPIASRDDSSSRRPNGLFAHNIQQSALQSVIPQRNSASGVLGRVQQELVDEGYVVGSFSIAGNANIFNSAKGVSRSPDILNAAGLTRLDRKPQSDRVRPAVEELNGVATTSLFGEEWARTVERTIKRTDELDEILGDGELTQPFEADSSLGAQFKQVAKLIKSRSGLGSNRNTFYVSRGGFDTHNDGFSTLNELLVEFDEALDSLVQELKLQGEWNNVVIMVGSEFGRTLTSNGVGTDHAWGGNYWMLGGGLKGGRVLGQYPSDLTDAGPLSLGRGRIIPTTSWDSVWNGVAQWLGVTDDGALDEVLPNRRNFDLFTQSFLFK